MYILIQLIRFYQFIVFLAALATWITPRSQPNQLTRILFRVTEPVLKPIRRVIPQMGGMDVSPFAAILLLQLIIWVLIRF